MAQRNKLYQALAAQTILVCLWDHFIVGFGLFIGFVDNKQHNDYHQPSPFKAFLTVLRDVSVSQLCHKNIIAAKNAFWERTVVLTNTS